MENTEFTQKEIDPRVLRTAFVQQWSDPVISKFLGKTFGDMGCICWDRASAIAREAADNFNLAKLRNGDILLEQKAAQSLGFPSYQAFVTFASQNPPKGIKQGANPPIGECKGEVVSLSLTEIVFKTKTGDIYSGDRAGIQQVAIGDRVIVSKFGRITKRGGE